MILCPDANPEERTCIVNGWIACPFLDVFYVSHAYIKNNYTDILEYIMYSIDNGYYLYFRINQEKLTVRMNVEFHKIFIYGYDKREKSIYVSDHYDYGRYTTVKIGFDEFLDWSYVKI